MPNMSISPINAFDKNKHFCLLAARVSLKLYFLFFYRRACVVFLYMLVIQRDVRQTQSLCFMYFAFTVNGGYTEWSQYTTCTKECGSGIKKRSRQCNNPSSQYGGTDCSKIGSAEESQSCNTQQWPSNIF